MMEDHKEMLKRREALKQKLAAAKVATMLTSPTESQPEERVVAISLDEEPTASPSAGIDLLNTSIVETGGPLNLNPFPDIEEEEEEAPTEGTRYARSQVVTEAISQVTTEAYVAVPATVEAKLRATPV